ncbi:glycosyltransferase, partial [Cellulomonas massiliensis]|uniref:glycosyltransferase n=1 Tax=Cellulomonas massiliensis TaxID=1465811 RepID=UPI00037EA4B4
MTRPTVSVVIPVRDDADELDGCLEALAAQTLAPLEVVVVDNGSRDASAQVARRWGARVVTVPTEGIPVAAAAGYDASHGEVVARLDADSRPPAHWVERVADAMSDRRVDAVTGVGTFHELPRAVGVGGAVLYLGAYYLLGGLAAAQVPLWGSSMAVRRSTWERVRHGVERHRSDVHDDLDLAFALGDARVRLDLGLHVLVSARSLRGAAQLRRRGRRAVRT